MLKPSFSYQKQHSKTQKYPLIHHVSLAYHIVTLVRPQVCHTKYCIIPSCTSLSSKLFNSFNYVPCFSHYTLSLVLIIHLANQRVICQDLTPLFPSTLPLVFTTVACNIKWLPWSDPRCS